MAGKKRKKTSGVKSFRDVLQKWNEYYINTDFGIGIQCDACNQWRRVFQYRDKSETPEVWTCDMWMIDNNQRGNCEMISNLTEDDFEDAKYEPGSMVWARMDGYDWWPGMIEDCPDMQEYFMKYKDAEDQYHVTFFGEKTFRKWITISRIRDFRDTLPNPKRKKSQRRQRRRNRNVLLEKAIEQANEATALSKKERLKHYSFLVRYTGPWKRITNPDKVTLPPTCNDVKTSEKSTESISEDTYKNSLKGGNSCPTPVAHQKQDGDDTESISNQNQILQEREPKKVCRQTLGNNECQEPNQTKETGFDLESDVSPIPTELENLSTPKFEQRCSEWLDKLNPPLTFPGMESSLDSVSENLTFQRSDTESLSYQDIFNRHENAVLEKNSDTSEAAFSANNIEDLITPEKLKKHWAIAEAIFQSHQPKYLYHSAV